MSESPAATTATIDAFHLPGLGEHEITGWNLSGPVIGPEGSAQSCGSRTGARLRHPVLDAAAVSRVIRHVRQARSEYLAGLPVPSIVQALARAARRIVDPDDAFGSIARAALPSITGYSPEMIELVLDRLATDWSENALRALFEAEFPGTMFEPFAAGSRVASAGSAAVRGGARTGAVRAVGPEFTFHIFSGNVPGVGVTSIMRSLLVRAAILGKLSRREPLLAALFARALASVDARLADCLAVTHWAGGDAMLENEAMSEADVIVVYGAAPAVRSVRSRAPVTTRIVEHGPRISVGMVGTNSMVSDAAASAVAMEVAWAVSVFDQQGCVSPHVVWVEGDTTVARRFARRLAEAMAEVEAGLPRGRVRADEAAAILEVRTMAEFRSIRGEDVVVFEGGGTSWTVICDAAADFEASCLNRTIRVKPIASLEEVPRLIEPFRGYIQTAALAGVSERLAGLADALADAGVTRITGFRRMPWPPPGWHHDGSGPLRELVRWVDLES
jgi:Acyl-CoA reductase (LuxC)